MQIVILFTCIFTGFWQFIMAISISVVICTYNRAKFITEALKSLVDQTYQKEDFEVIVANNNSTDDTERICKEFMASYTDFHIQYYLETRQGASFARNTGAHYATGELLCFMDDDAIAERDFLQNIWAFYQLHPEVGGFGGRIIPRYVPSEPVWMSHYVSSLVGNFEYANEVVEFSPNRYPLESNMIVTKKGFNEVGGFNTAIPGVKGTLRIGGEGKDFFFRLKERGHKIFYVPNVVVHHVVEVEKLTKEYMYRVASGIGRGERQRIAPGGFSFLKKLAEYLFKLGGSIAIGLYYILTGKPSKCWPVIQFRIDVLRGFLGR